MLLSTQETNICMHADDITINGCDKTLGNEISRLENIPPKLFNGLWTAQLLIQLIQLDPVIFV